MPVGLVSKYPLEFFLDFQSVDRFLYRASDLRLTGQFSDELQERLNKCHLYVVAKRPRLTIVTGSIETTETFVRLQVQYYLDGLTHQASFDIPRRLFMPEEVRFAASERPHRAILSYNASGQLVGET